MRAKGGTTRSSAILIRAIFLWSLLQIIYQPARDVQPHLGRVVWDGAAVRQDEPVAPGLGDGGENFVAQLLLAAVRERAALVESAHQGLIGQCQGLAQAGAGEAIAPTDDGDGVVAEEIEVDLVAGLIEIGVDVDGVEPAIARAFEGSEVRGTPEAEIFVAREVGAGRAHAREEDAACTRVDSG